MKLAWATDLHLDHASRTTRRAFIASLAACDADVLVLTGDTGISSTVVNYLSEIAEAFSRPVHVVLGNHDFYGGSIIDVRSRVASLAQASANLTYLHQSGVQALSANCALVGVDGWGDARYGNWGTTNVALNDFRLIDELEWNRIGRPGLLQALRDLGDDSAHRLRPNLLEALANFRHVVVATHVPPSPESAWHEGAPSNPEFAPYFACKAVGDLLKVAAEENPDREITVLCGHSHGGGVVLMGPNLRVLTGPSVYERPALQEALLLP
jgi:3',5'-cyclic-AMP phosphodiesterase